MLQVQRRVCVNYIDPSAQLVLILCQPTPKMKGIVDFVGNLNLHFNER